MPGEEPPCPEWDGDTGRAPTRVQGLRLEGPGVGVGGVEKPLCLIFPGIVLRGFFRGSRLRAPSD